MNNYPINILQAEFCKTLNHPERIEILQTLRDGPKPVSEIVKITGHRQAFVSRHLSVLRHARIITQIRKGQDVFYGLTNPQIIEICDLMHKVVLEQLNNRSELIQSIQDQL